MTRKKIILFSFFWDDNSLAQKTCTLMREKEKAAPLLFNSVEYLGSGTLNFLKG